MKTLHTAPFVAALLAATTPALAVPQVITYAARVEQGPASTPVDGTVSASFALFHAATGGSPVWEEADGSVIVVDGDLVYDLGADATNLLDENVLDGELFLSVTINGETLEPRMPLRSVPFALAARRSEEAGSIGGLTADDLALKAETLTATQVDERVTRQLDQRLADRATLSQVDSKIAAARVPFSSVTGVPAGFADGTDNDTQYTAGSGLVLNGTTFSIPSATINSTQIKDGTIVAADIAAGAVATVQLAVDAVTGSKIADGAVNASKLSGSLEVFARPAGCGAGIQIGDGPCRTQMCGVSSGSARFYTCDAGCNQVNPVFCPVSTVEARPAGGLDSSHTFLVHQRAVGRVTFP